MFTHPQLKLNITNLLPFFKPATKKKLKNTVFTDSGRSAFILAIEQLNLQNSEMLFPAYICDIFLPIFEHYNIKPIYLDIDLKTFNIKISEIERKITPQTKSILVCHTYGLPVEIDKVLEVAKKHNLKIIEDCAHVFPLKVSGDCAFFSLPKFLPVIGGGMLVCKKPIKINLKKYGFKISNLIKLARLCPYLATFSEKFRKAEKTLAVRRFTPPKQAPKCSLKIFNWYLDNLEKPLEKRTELAKYFQEKLKKIGFQTSPGITYISALVPGNVNRDELFYKLRKKGVFCSRIWQKPINPDLPNTAEAARRIINFPLQNWFTKKDIDKIISYI